MSLRLRQTVAGQPSRYTEQSLACLTIGQEAFVAYTSHTNVVLSNEELEVIGNLRFWDALPHRSSSSSPLGNVQGVIAVDGLIIAWCDVHAIFWRYHLGKHGKSWVVHSTVLSSEPITTLDYREGTLVLGTTAGIQLWRAGQDRDVVFWDRLWSRPYPSPTSMCISPSKSHIAWFQKAQRSVHILGLSRKGEAIGMPQELRHPREISWIGWRKSVSSSGDAVLYTITSDPVFRIYSPVLDDPTWFQLVSSLDHRAFAKSSPSTPTRKGKDKDEGTGCRSMWALDAEVLRAGLLDEISQASEGKSKTSVMARKILEALATEESDVIVYTDDEGNMTMRSIENLDRKPPTLIKSRPITSLCLSEVRQSGPWSSRSQLLHAPATSSLLAFSHASNRIQGSRISMSQLIAARPSGISALDSTANKEEITSVNLQHPVHHFVRTPNGTGLLAVCEEGEVGVWSKEKVGKPIKGRPTPKSLAGKGHWNMPNSPGQCAIFAKGRAIVFYTQSDNGPQVTLQHLDPGSTRPTDPVVMPDFDLDFDDDLAMLLAISDIDDGYNGKSRHTQRAVIMAVSKSGEAWCWRVTSHDAFAIIPETNHDNGKPDIRLLHKYRLPVQGGSAPAWVLPVDPMGWHTSVIDWKSDTPLQDMVLTISESGVLEYWQPRLGQHLAVDESDDHGNHDGGQGTPWVRSGSVDTGRRNVVMARCSSRKKTVLICDNTDGKQEATIWDSNVSEFATGLELTHHFDGDEPVQDLDWTTTSDLQSVLAVGFAHTVVLVCEQRMSYSEKSPGWAPFVTINLEQYTSVPINDSIWLSGGSLAVGAGNQIYVFSRFLDRGNVPSPSASAKSVVLDPEEPEDLFQLIAWQNGPLLDYHPTVLAQCLIWDKLDLVKRILVELHRSLKESEDLGRKNVVFKRFDPFDFVKSTQNVAQKTKSNTRKYDGLFDAEPVIADDDDDEYNERFVTDLLKRLDGPVHLPLSANEKALLVAIIEGTYEVEQQRRALDLCGLRYLISVEQLASHFRRHETTDSVNDTTAHQHRLSFRNIAWAAHSESQDMLLTASTKYCTNGKMMWNDAKALGVFLWLNSSEVIKSQLEVVARNTFMAQEDRDPTSCSLIFFALGKKKVVHGLWRQAPGHKEQNMMLKFLGNDFTQERWKTAALKNAYALLSKNRYEYAAAFFMLADQPRDAISVCLRQMNDWQLAVALAKALEPDGSGPLLKWILTDRVVPMAFEGGHRWLASWAFWSLGRRDLSVRVLISPLNTVALSWSPSPKQTCGLSENDDPSLLLMFQYLKSRSLQTAKGTSEIPSKLEFDFVLHNARVFFRMGCHSLALDLLRNWSFERPFFPSSQKRSQAGRPQYSPVRQRRPSFMLSNGHNRHESMVMDMDVLAESEPVSRVPSPPTVNDTIAQLGTNGDEGQHDTSVKSEEPVPEEKPKKMGNLMKELKQDVTQGAMEFDMDSFF